YFSALGGYVAARWGPGREMAHALLVSICTAALGAVTAAAGMGQGWHWIATGALVSLGVAATLAGGLGRRAERRARLSGGRGRGAWTVVLRAPYDWAARVFGPPATSGAGAITEQEAGPPDQPGLGTLLLHPGRYFARFDAARASWPVAIAGLYLPS